MYSVTQESVSDLAAPANLIRGSSLVINGSDYTYAVNCYLIALPHSATHSVAASLECQHTGRLASGRVTVSAVQGLCSCWLTDHTVLARWSILHCVSKKACDYIFCNNWNNECPIIIIFGTVINETMCHRMVVSFPTSSI